MLLIVLLLVLVGLLFLGALGYLVHRHPALARPLTVVLTGAGVLVGHGDGCRLPGAGL
ncbi:hypothetical protein ACWD00_40815 [Streptomyces viridiviolaceus]